MRIHVTDTAIHSKTAEKWGPIILYNGCTMSRRQMGSRYATYFLLDKYGFDWMVLDKEKCCGSPVRRSGGFELADQLRDFNLDQAVRAGVDTMVTACPGCGSQLLSEEAEERGIKIRHTIEMYYDLAKNKELYLPEQMIEIPHLKVTAHFPCHLQRGMGIDLETVHSTIIGAFPNMEYIPLPEADVCCGAGGGVRASQKPLSFKIRERKIKNVLKTETNIVLNACSFCELQIDEGLREIKADTRAIMPQGLIAMMFKDVGEEVERL